MIEESQDLVQKVSRGGYKYFKYNLNPENTTNNFTIVLNDINGSSELFYSFNNTKSKDDQAFLTIDEDGEDTNLKPEMDSRISLRNFNESEILNTGTKYYQITNAEAKDLVYFSVKGLDDENEFQIYIFNRTVVKDLFDPSNVQNSIHDYKSILKYITTLLVVNILFKY